MSAPHYGFRGTATLMRQNPQVMRVFTIGMLVIGAFIVVPLVAEFAPPHTRAAFFGAFRRVLVVLVVFGGGAYAFFLSRALVMVKEVVDLTVDSTGLSVGGRVIAPRASIVKAHIQPASPARVVSGGVRTPALPVMLVLKLTKGDLFVDLGSEANTLLALKALGF